MKTFDENLEKLSGEITIIKEESLEKTSKVDIPRSGKVIYAKTTDQ